MTWDDGRMVRREGSDRACSIPFFYFFKSNRCDSSGSAHPSDPSGPDHHLTPPTAQSRDSRQQPLARVKGGFFCFLTYLPLQHGQIRNFHYLGLLLSSFPLVGLCCHEWIWITMESCFVILHIVFYFILMNVMLVLIYVLIWWTRSKIVYGSSCKLAKCYYNMMNQYSFFFFFISLSPCSLTLPTHIVYFSKKKERKKILQSHLVD